jgi:hypothetical protein
MAMRTRLQRITDRRRPTPERRPGHVPAPQPAAEQPERRVRDAGGPEDLAVYSCGCGMHFEAAVSTSVACPKCGAGQAW